MASKASLTEQVKAFATDAVADGLRERPDLLSHRDDKGRNWLHLCASVDVTAKPERDATHSVRLADVLLDAGIDVNEPAFTEDRWHATALWYAVARGRNLALATHLLDRGSTPEHCLWAAAFRDDEAMIRLLIDRGAPLEAVAEGETPLLGAVKVSRFTGARVLLDAGADPDFRDATGMTALHYMLKKGTEAAHFRSFVERGARGDIAGPDGRTAAQIMRRKRDRVFHSLADELTGDT